MASIRSHRRRLCRWERWERKFERLVPDLMCTPGSLRAYNAWAHQVGRKANREVGRL